MKLTSRTGLLPGKSKVILFRKQVKENRNTKLLLFTFKSSFNYQVKLYVSVKKQEIMVVINVCSLVYTKTLIL